MTSQTSSEFLYNALNIENMDNMDLSSDIKLEESSTNSLIGNKRKLHVKPEPYKLSDSSECAEPPSKKMRLDTDSNDNSDRMKSNHGSKDENEFNFPDLEIPDSTTNSKPNSTTSNNSHCNPTTANNNNNNSNYGMIGGSVSPHHPQYLLPVVPTPHAPPHPQYFVPIVPHHMPHHMSPYGHTLPFPPHINPGYLHHNHYAPYHTAHHHRQTATRSVKVQNDKSSKSKRKRSNRNKSKNKMDETSDDTNSELLDDEIVPNSKLMTDKSPFKTTYISREEEIELKNTNSTLYSQFHHARQAIYQQYKQKSQAIRHSNVLTQEKRKLNMKMAAIDAKVQEKKLFLSYLEMSKPQPNSWLVSNSALSMNAFARKITHQTKTPSSYSKPNSNSHRNHKTKKKNNEERKRNANEADTEDASKQEKEEKAKQATTAKRVKKPKFSEYNVRVLRDWYETHTNNPYPSSSEKHLMCQLTGLTKYQVSRWFCNVRTRKPPPELSDNDEDIIHNLKRKNGSCSGGGDTEYNEYSDYYALHPHVAHPHPHPHPHAPHHPLSYHAHLQSPHSLNLHHLQSLNLPPMTPIPLPHTTNCNSMSVFNFNHAPINVRKQQNVENHMMDVINSNENSEGLMPSINSEFNINQQSTNLMPPPLIDEDSRDQT